MKRFLIIISIGIAVIFTSILTCAALLFKTAPGKSILIDIAEEQLGRATNSDLTIGSLSGNLPSDLTITNLILKNKTANDEIIDTNSTPWITVQKIHIAWRPLSLLKGKIVIIDSLVEGAQWNALPPPNPSPKSEKKPHGLKIPTHLPSIRVENINFSAISISKIIFGKQATMQGQGSLEIGSRDIHAELHLETDSKADHLEFFIDRVSSTNMLDIDISARSTSAGLLANVININDNVALTIKGSAPADNFSMTYEGITNQYGSFSGKLTSNLEKLDAIHTELSVNFGEQLQSIREHLGQSIHMVAALHARPAGMALKLEELSSKVFVAAGNAQWTNKNDALEAASLTTAISLTEHADEALRDILGTKIALSADIQSRNETYGVDVSLETDHATLMLFESVSDLATMFDGQIGLNVKESNQFPIIKQSSANFNADLSLSKDQQFALNNFTGELQSGAKANGNASVDLNTNKFNAKFKLSATENALTNLYPSVQFESASNVNIIAEGSIDNFTLTLDGVTPIFSLSEQKFEPHQFDAKIANLPKTPNGAISLHSDTANTTFNSSVSTDADGTMELENLTYTGSGFSLTGAGSFSPPTSAVNAEFNFEGMPGNVAIPGVPIAGSVQAKVHIAENATIQINSPGLRTPYFVTRNFSLSTDGPLTSINSTLNAEMITIGDAVKLRDLRSTAVVSQNDDTEVTINALSFKANNIPVLLNEVAVIKLGEKSAVKNLRATVDDSGSVNLDGEFTPDYWTARILSNAVPLLDTGSALDLNMVLDTRQSTKADGNFSLSSTLTQERTTPINGRFEWNNDKIHIRNNEKNDALTLNVKIPALLEKSEHLQINSEGPLRGKINYNGRIEPLAALLPVTFQSLEGIITTDIIIGNTLAEPSVEGSLKISEGVFTDIDTGLSLIGITLDGTAHSNTNGTAINFNFEARGPQQTTSSIKSNGMIKYADQSIIDIRLNLDKAALAAEPISSLIASGDISIQGQPENLKIDGAIVINELSAETKVPPNTGLVDINIVSNDLELAIKDETAATDVPSIPLSLTIDADDRIFVRGRGMESEWKTNIAISGTTTSPLILGSLDIKKGYIDFADRRFDISRGKISFDRLTQNNPTLDIRAEATANDVTAAIVIEGRAQNPAISLTSTPSLPNNDVLAYILFGEPANELNTFEALQVAQALASLGAIGPFGGTGPLGSARKAVGLDLLSLDAGSGDEAASLTVGKYVADGLFVSATQDADGANGSVRVEYEVRDNITVETEIKQDGDQTVSANWKRDF